MKIYIAPLQGYYRNFTNVQRAVCTILRATTCDKRTINETPIQYSCCSWECLWV